MLDKNNLMNVYVLLYEAHKANQNANRNGIRFEAASKNGDVLNVRRLLEEMMNQNCTDSVSQIQSVSLLLLDLTLSALSVKITRFNFTIVW